MPKNSLAVPAHFSGSTVPPPRPASEAAASRRTRGAFLWEELRGALAEGLAELRAQPFALPVLGHAPAARREKGGAGEKVSKGLRREGRSWYGMTHEFPSFRGVNRFWGFTNEGNQRGWFTSFPASNQQVDSGSVNSVNQWTGGE